MAIALGFITLLHHERDYGGLPPDSVG
jgi:hypothetical protein